MGNKNTETITVAPEHTGIAFNLPKSYRESPPMKPCEKYEAIRGTWSDLSDDMDQSINYAYAIYKDTVKEVYKIEVKQWFPAGSQEYFTRKYIKFGAEDQKGKKEFMARIAPDDVRDRYLNKKIKLDTFPRCSWQKVPKKN